MKLVCFGLVYMLSFLHRLPNDDQRSSATKFCQTWALFPVVQRDQWDVGHLPTSSPLALLHCMTLSVDMDNAIARTSFVDGLLVFRFLSSLPFLTFHIIKRILA